MWGGGGGTQKAGVNDTGRRHSCQDQKLRWVHLEQAHQQQLWGVALVLHRNSEGRQAGWQAALSAGKGGWRGVGE